MNAWNRHIHTGTQNVHNVHNAHIDITKGIQKHKKTLTTSQFRYETFYYLWVKRFFDIRRVIHNLSMLTFPSAPPRPHTTHGTRRKASASSESQPSSSDAKTQLTDFSQIPKILHATLPVHDVIHISRSYISLGFLFWHLWMIHPPRTRVNTCAQVAPN